MHKDYVLYTTCTGFLRCLQLLNCVYAMAVVASPLLLYAMGLTPRGAAIFIVYHAVLLVGAIYARTRILRFFGTRESCATPMERLHRNRQIEHLHALQKRLEALTPKQRNAFTARQCRAYRQISRNLAHYLKIAKESFDHGIKPAYLTVLELKLAILLPDKRQAWNFDNRTRSTWGNINRSK